MELAVVLGLPFVALVAYLIIRERRHKTPHGPHDRRQAQAEQEARRATYGGGGGI